jgi:hypothetical protein
MYVVKVILRPTNGSQKDITITDANIFDQRGVSSPLNHAKDKGTIEKAIFVQIELAILNSSGKNIPIKKAIAASTNK